MTSFTPHVFYKGASARVATTAAEETAFLADDWVQGEAADTASSDDGPFTAADRVKATTVAYAATVTPNCDTTDVLNIGALTGNITIANPTGTPVDGQSLRLRLAQDATGSRTHTFGSAYAFGTDVTAALLPSTASAKYEALFVYNAVAEKWRAVSIVRGF